MKITSILGRGVLALSGLLAAASVIDDAVQIGTHRSTIGPELACAMMWDVWGVSWVVAMIWSRRAIARPPALEEVIYWVAPAVGFGLLAFGSSGTNFTPIWVTPAVVGWSLAALCGAGLLFTWWARIALGPLWSGSVSRKEEHSIVQSGPYRLVRHPIYTGLILAAFAHALIIGQLANLGGALVMMLGFWLKARFEERFLGEQLGASAYSDYRRRTPMLVPLWPAGR